MSNGSDPTLAPGAAGLALTEAEPTTDTPWTAALVAAQLGVKRSCGGSWATRNFQRH